MAEKLKRQNTQFFRTTRNVRNCVNGPVFRGKAGRAGRWKIKRFRNIVIGLRNGLLTFSGSNSGVEVKNLDVQLLGTFNNFLSLLGGDRVSDLGSIFVVVHQEHVEFSGVVNDKLVQAIGQKVAGGLGRSVTSLGEGAGSSPSTSHSVINTLGSSVGSFLMELGTVHHKSAAEYVRHVVLHTWSLRYLSPSWRTKDLFLFLMICLGMMSKEWSKH